MDALTTGIINFQQAAMDSKIQFAVAAKILDNQQYQGNAAVQLIDAASNGITQAGDELTAAATGLGGQVDTYA